MAKHQNKWHEEKVIALEKKTAMSDAEYKEYINFNVKKINGIYADDKKLAGLQGRTFAAGNFWSITTREELESLLRRAYSTPHEAAKVARILEALDPNFAKIMSYFSDMFHVRYTVLPMDIKLDAEETKNDEEFMSKYREMLAIVDNTHLETTVPAILKELYIAGSVYLYATKYKPANSVSTMMLPQEYCRPAYSTNHGTIVYQFNFKYFDTLNAVQRDEALTLFPKEFTKLYSEYLTDKIEWKTLDPKYTTAIMLNRSGMTPYLDIMSDIINYKEFKQNDLVRSRNQLKLILTHKIPMYENRMIFDFDEVKAIQGAISSIVNQHEGMETITVFGETDLIRLQDEGKTENKQVKQAYENIYSSAGLNANMVTNNTIQALEASFSIDKATVIKHLNSIETYINLVINNLYNLKPYLAKVKLLHITVKNEDTDVKRYQSMAEYGIGKIDAVVASGIKQIELLPTKRLEDAIDIHSILTPLQSAHTTKNDGNSESGSETEETDNKDKVDKSNETDDE